MRGPSRLERELVRVLAAYEVDCVLDVGANTGQFARLLRQACAWEGPIVSFEPVHANFLRLTRAMEDDDAWRGFEIALGSRSGTRVMRHYPHASSFDTLLSPSDYGRRRFPTLASPCCEVPVTMQRLDAVVDDAVEPGTGRSILLKVDTQGFDLEVLRGAERCLHRIAALQLELPALPIYEGLPTFGVTIEEIMTLGFDPIGFFPESRTENLRVVEFNALFGSRR